MFRCRKRKSATKSIRTLQICTASAILQRNNWCVAEFAMQILPFFVVLFVDMITRPEEKEIEEKLAVNEKIESNEDIEIDRGCEEIEVASDELMTLKES